MLNKEQLALTMEIVNRSEKLGLMQGDKLTALIDLEKRRNASICGLQIC